MNRSHRSRPRHIRLLQTIGMAFAAVLVFEFVDACANERPVFRLEEATIEDINRAYDVGVLTSERLVQLYLRRIEAYDTNGPGLNSIITLNPNALLTAQALDVERRMTGPRSPLHGIPVVIKDGQDTFDMPTTWGSQSLRDSTPPDDATVVQRLREAGAIILAKSNLDELGFWANGLSSVAGQTRNPYDLDRLPGGSSGGTAVAVAANLAVIGTGSDAGGSIGMPAQLNSLVGLRPTVGLIPGAGGLGGFVGRDVRGPIGRSVADVAAMMNVTAGPDPIDPVTASSAGHVPASYLDSLDVEAMTGARIGVARELLEAPAVETAVRRVFEIAIQQLRDFGAEIVDPFNFRIRDTSFYVDFDYDVNDYFDSLDNAAPFGSVDELLSSGKFLPTSETQFSSSLRRGDIAPDLDPPFAAFLSQRDAYASELIAEMDNAGVDAILYPLLGRTAPAIGTDVSWISQFSQRGTLAPALGFPLINVPAGFSVDGLPVGIQLMGRPFSEPSLLGLAYSFEQATQHRRPPTSTPPLPGETIDYRDYLDDLCGVVAHGGQDLLFDLSGDDIVDSEDSREFLRRINRPNGDVDMDGVVQFSDLLVLAQNFGQSAVWSQGDFDCNGEVQFTDFVIQSSHFQAGTIATTPEPSDASNTALALLAVLPLWRRRSTQKVASRGSGSQTHQKTKLARVRGS